MGVHLWWIVMLCLWVCAPSPPSSRVPCAAASWWHLKFGFLPFPPSIYFMYYGGTSEMNCGAVPVCLCFPLSCRRISYTTALWWHLKFSFLLSPPYIYFICYGGTSLVNCEAMPVDLCPITLIQQGVMCDCTLMASNNLCLTLPTSYISYKSWRYTFSELWWCSYVSVPYHPHQQDVWYNCSLMATKIWFLTFPILNMSHVS